MFIHPSYILFFTSLNLSIFMLISSNSWLMAWLAMEINLMSFIPLTLKKKNKSSSEAALKYFLTQAIASVIIITAVCITHMNFEMALLMISFALLMKMGAAPLHQWMPSMIEGLTWQTIFMLLVLQKINPFTILYSTNQSSYMMFIFITTSAILGSIGGLTHSSLRKIMVYSSIAHMGWMLSAILMQKSNWIIYLMLYSMILFGLIMIFNFNELYFLNQMLMKPKMTLAFLTAASILSLGGLPPFSGFLPKLMMTLDLVKTSNFFLLFVLLSSTFISLFFYTRMLLTNLVFSSTSTMIFPKQIENSQTSNFFNCFMLIIPSMIFMLI